MPAMPAVPALLAFAVSFVCLRLLLSRLGRGLALDQPNERSLHDRPVPRTGGIAVLAGAAVALAVGVDSGIGSLWLSMALAAGLALLSFADDTLGLPTVGRLAAHLASAGVLVWYVLSPMHPAALVLLALAVAWTANLYNFMDGSDGLAGGMAVIGFGTYALAAHLAGGSALATLSAALAAAAAAFLTSNFHPARIFMGDVGSVPLGFLAGALGVVGWRDDLWPLWFPMLVFAPFMCDATLTLLKRVLRGESASHAHREHYYQRLVRMGFGHRGTAYIEYAAMLGCALVALGARNQRPAVQLGAIAAATAVLIAVAVWVDLRWARHVKAAP